MIRELPKNGEFWKHFKGGIYKVWFVGVRNWTNWQNDENLYICYQPWAGNPKHGVYIREINEFMSEVDHEKYPDAEQKYRFEKIELN